MPEKRSSNQVAGRPAGDTGDSSRGLGLVMAGAAGAGGLAAIVLLCGGGLFAALLVYTFGASGAVAALAMRGNRPVRTLHPPVRRPRYDDRLHHLPS